jgi:hypothetical protein
MGSEVHHGGELALLASFYRLENINFLTAPHRL